MTEQEPGPPVEYTAGEVGARRHSVGESVRVDESGSLNVPPTRATGEGRRDRIEHDSEEGESHVEKQGSSPMDLANSGGHTGPPVSEEGRQTAATASRRVRMTESEVSELEEAASPATAVRKRGPGLAVGAAGLVVMLVVRRLLRRRSK
jgi:hypothetical protein